MLERELKLHVPDARQAVLEQALHKLNATVLPLHACYFDTEKHELAKAKIALRLRNEGGQWVQTIKAPGPDELSRLEINHNRPEPTLDLNVYRGSAVEASLAQLQDPLQLRYETIVHRLVASLTDEAGVVELAYDTGLIKAGTLELPISELELELVSGDTSHLFALARHWLQQHRLILDLRSKAERGEILTHMAHKSKALAQQTHPVEPLQRARRAGAVKLAEAASLEAAYQLCANDCMNQIIRNACLLAGVDAPASAQGLHVEYVHQLRVGIRRLRSCWKFFGKWLAIDKAALNAHLRFYFSELGKVRDHYVIELTVTPRLFAAGMTARVLHDQPKHAEPTQSLAANPEFQAALLGLMEHLVVADGGTQGTTAPTLASASAKLSGAKADKHKADSGNTDQGLGKLLSKRLNKRLKRLCRQGEQFAQMSVDEQHALRKRVKTLRYSMEFSASLLAEESLAPLRSALEALQGTLGELNDFYIAHDFYAAIAKDQAVALFAMGWLSAMQEQKVIQAQADITRLTNAGRFKAKNAS